MRWRVFLFSYAKELTNWRHHELLPSEHVPHRPAKISSCSCINIAAVGHVIGIASAVMVWFRAANRTFNVIGFGDF